MLDLQQLPVRSSAHWVLESAQHVQIDKEAVATAANRLASRLADGNQRLVADFDSELHFYDGGPLTAQYLLVVDALNFCFWPDGELEYACLAGGIKASLKQDPGCLAAQRLASIDGAGVRALIGWHRDLPQQEERARLLREVASGLLQHFKGQAAELVKAATQSAVSLVQLLAAHFPGFRDHAVYKGRQVFFYKRAQIFVGDLYGAFGGKGLGSFMDIHQLTMFADYRVPVVLRLMGLLSYSQQLAHQVDSQHEVVAGSEQELEIRAASVVAVELLTDAVNQRVLQQQQQPEAPSAAELQQPSHRNQLAQAGLQAVNTQPSKQLLSIQLDWWLWEEGERMRAEHPPHHRTWTIYY
eukprot:GHRR01011445.1.p1 GENE.GHRR01011445.1~~GHRR01011445.1.p1  ORF type:complete len:355 (+),score=124.50 GHRR01011445.1:793-1857(+)